MDGHNGITMVIIIRSNVSSRIIWNVFYNNTALLLIKCDSTHTRIIIITSTILSLLECMPYIRTRWSYDLSVLVSCNQVPIDTLRRSVPSRMVSKFNNLLIELNKSAEIDAREGYLCSREGPSAVLLCCIKEHVYSPVARGDGAP